jgi:hypothetical protein
VGYDKTLFTPKPNLCRHLEPVKTRRSSQKQGENDENRENGQLSICRLLMLLFKIGIEVPQTLLAQPMGESRVGM